MISNDTIKLLKECDSGTKMAVTSIDEILEQVKNNELKSILQACKEKHSDIGNQIHKILSQNNEKDKDPNPVAKSMSWIKTNVKMMMDDNDQTIADLLTDGCNMGVKSLNKYLNQYTNADDTSKNLCTDLICIENDLLKNLTSYL